MGSRGLDDPLDLPEGVRTGAEHTGGQATDVWVANVPVDVARLFRACVCSVARRLKTGPGRALEAMFDHAIASCWVPTPRAYRAFARDGWRCTVPGCTSQKSLHQRGVQTGLIRISGHAPDALVFEMPVGRFRSGDRAVWTP